MVNFHDPTVLAQDGLALAKFSHVVDGLYMWVDIVVALHVFCISRGLPSTSSWEFLTTLDFEWSVIQGHHPYRWTIWIYSITRLATLMAVILNLVILNIMTQINCQVLVKFTFAFAYIAFSLSSFLIVLRIIAIWNKNKAVLALTVSLWLTDVSFLIRGITQVRSVWVPAQYSCSSSNVESNKATAITLLVTDIVLLLVMFSRMFRLRRRGADTFDLGRLLWKQGVIWLLLATVAELPPVVFICLNLNDAFNGMFLMPALITMSIAATRIYRSLADFSSSTDIYHPSGRGLGNPQRIGRTVSNAKLTATPPIPLDQKIPLGVATHEAYKHHPTSQIGRHTPYIGMDGQLGDKPHRLGFDDRLESGV
ncbi:hypothetical protein BJV74DRAFT_889934 [Russula compacta]|nr:hypothetical protein BJV74DRAFT_889934 [Russula compacta]